MAMHRKAFNVDIDDTLSDDFARQTLSRGYTKYRAIEGALRAFLALPPDIQVALMETESSDIVQLLKEKLLDSDLEERLVGLSLVQKQKIAGFAKEVAKIVSEGK